MELKRILHFRKLFIAFVTEFCFPFCGDEAFFGLLEENLYQGAIRYIIFKFYGAHGLRLFTSFDIIGVRSLRQKHWTSETPIAT